MSERAQWKMIHVLNTCNSGRMTEAELAELGIVCYTDTIVQLVNDGIVHSEQTPWGPSYYLSNAAVNMVNKFIVASGERVKGNMYIDQPSCFVVMPFSEKWSGEVYDEFIKPAVEAAGLQCIRGDEIERTGILNANIFKTIQQAGFVIAEISAPNPNVYYELGVVDALGKETFILFDPKKNKRKPVPADKQGVHYTEYSQQDLKKAKKSLSTKLKERVNYYKLLSTVKYCTVTV
ncbi:MAG: hypothetical protein V4685_03565 [Bacteroidota bacterium]